MAALYFIDEVTRLRLALARYHRQVDEEAAQAKRTNEQLAHAKAYGERHNTEPPEAA